MSKTSETGHAKNMANLESLISAITLFGEKYNPSKESIKLGSLQALLVSTKESFNAHYVAQTAYSKAVDDRVIAFEPLSKLITRINNALKASDSNMKYDESVQSIIRKLQGQRASAKLSAADLQTMEPDGKPKTQISTAQMSYNSRLENFDRLIIQLSSIPEYAPNEDELKIGTLQALLAVLKAANSKVIATYLQLDKARALRNETLYHPITGLVDLASDTKTYIKSLYGPSSPEYKQVAGLHFENRI